MELEYFLVSSWGQLDGLFSGANLLLVSGRVRLFASKNN